jgi:hypothetical protein
MCRLRFELRAASCDLRAAGELEPSRLTVYKDIGRTMPGVVSNLGLCRRVMQASVFPRTVCKLLILKRKWWNWQTHHLEGVAPKGVGVQIPPSAPSYELSLRIATTAGRVPDGVFCYDDFDCSDSRYRLPVSDCGRFAAERKERRPGRGIWRSGQPDSVWSARRGVGSFAGDDMVRDYFHAHVDHAFDFCGAPNGARVGAFGSEANADEITAGDTGRTFNAAGRSAEPGADTEISCLWSARRPRRPPYYTAGGARRPSPHRTTRHVVTPPGTDSLPFPLLSLFVGHGLE